MARWLKDILANLQHNKEDIQNDEIYKNVEKASQDTNGIYQNMDANTVANFAFTNEQIADLGVKILADLELKLSDTPKPFGAIEMQKNLGEFQNVVTNTEITTFQQYCVAYQKSIEQTWKDPNLEQRMENFRNALEQECISKGYNPILATQIIMNKMDETQDERKSKEEVKQEFDQEMFSSMNTYKEEIAKNEIMIDGVSYDKTLYEKALKDMLEKEQMVTVMLETNKPLDEIASFIQAEINNGLNSPNNIVRMVWEKSETTDMSLLLNGKGVKNIDYLINNDIQGFSGMVQSLVPSEQDMSERGEMYKQGVYKELYLHTNKDGEREYIANLTPDKGYVNGLQLHYAEQSGKLTDVTFYGRPLTSEMVNQNQFLANTLQMLPKDLTNDVLRLSAEHSAEQTKKNIDREEQAKYRDKMQIKENAKIRAVKEGYIKE